MELIHKDMKVAKVFESYPATQPVFKKFGFGALTNPILRNSFGKMTSIEKACSLHHVDLNDFLASLNRSLSDGAADAPSTPNSSKASMDELIQVNNILNTNIRTLTEEYPEVERVFVKHFGEGCYSCPAFGMENAAFACSMHNTDPVLFAKDCLEIIKKGRKDQKNSILFINANQTISEIAKNYPDSLKVFSRYGLDCCCGGDQPIKKAALTQGIDYQQLVDDLLNEIKNGN